MHLANRKRLLMRSKWLGLVDRICVLAPAAVSFAGAPGWSGGTEKRSGIDPTSFDKAVRPQDDLFRHVNGGWIRRAEIPADRALFGSFVQLLDKSEANLRAIIEDAAKTDNPAGSEARKVGDLYASFMDEARAQQQGLEPIKADLERIEG